jgi:Uncharacterised protein conserved in bacteria (DUF2313)
LSACRQYDPAAGDALVTLQRHLPTGVAWDAYRSPGKRAYRLWQSLARGFDDASRALCRLVQELNPYQTAELLPEWEAAVGLPDPCLPTAQTLEERRFWVIWRLTKRRWTTPQDWRDLASLFGLKIDICPGWIIQKPALYPAVYPKRYDIFPKLGRFRVYIDIIGVVQHGYDYGVRIPEDGYPVPYGKVDEASAAFMCLIERMRPVNVIVIWNENPRQRAFGYQFDQIFTAADV